MCAVSLAVRSLLVHAQGARCESWRHSQLQVAQPAGARSQLACSSRRVPGLVTTTALPLREALSSARLGAACRPRF